MAQLASTLQAHEARDNFYQILDEVQNKHRHFTITLRGKAKAIIISIHEHESWLKALNIISTQKSVTDTKTSINKEPPININNYYFYPKKTKNKL